MTVHFLGEGDRPVEIEAAKPEETRWGEAIAMAIAAFVIAGWLLLAWLCL